jgi:SAM-dependent methyltransferase
MSRESSPVDLDLRHWARHVDATERALLTDAVGPVLDIGCGAGRLVEALRDRGVRALGIDAAPAAIALARSRGVHVVTKSVFDPMPDEGSWATVLLLDGNIGIGGDAVRLLQRVHELLAPAGRALVELEPRGTPTRSGLVRLEVATRMVGLFPWCWVGADDIGDIAAQADLTLDASRTHGRRSFSWLRRSGLPASAPPQTLACRRQS